MQTNNKTEIWNIDEAIKLWKELKVDRCEMEFSCGGDSMNDTNFHLYDKKDNVIESEELTDYFDNEVYKNVEFYEVSDGHYMGEYGKVEITLEEDGVDDAVFVYDKQATAEWEETSGGTMYVELSDKESDVLKKVSNINGGVWNNQPNVNYRQDCVITEEEDEILDELIERIENLSDEFEIEGRGEEADESRSFESDIELEEGKLLVQVNARFYYTEECND